MKARPTIALMTSSEGHFSISEAIREVLEKDYDVAVYKQHVVFNTGYKVFYRLFPNLFSIPFSVKDTYICLAIRRLFFLRYKRKLLTFFEETQPDMCITTYFMYIAALEWYRQQTGTDFINVTTDPWTIHPIVFAADPTLNVTFDETSLAATEDCDFPVTIQPWGWFVRQAYEAEYDQKKAKRAIGLQPDVLTFLLAGGSEGSQKISELLPHLLKSSQPLQIIVACGSNRLMLQQVKLLYSRNLPPHLKVIPLGFTHRLERYMRAADLVVGKAGPNMIFESVATKTPFFAITHISGQEDGNLDIIRKYQLGYVEERIPKAAALLQDIIRHPDQLQAFQTQLQSLAAYNHASKEILVTTVKKYLATKGKSTHR